MPTPLQIRNTVEQRMRALLADLIQRQQVYRAMNGRFWQGPRTHQQPPADGLATAPDTSAAVNGSESWQAFGAPLPATIECAFHVSTYAGPQGDGYIVTATVVVNGETWQRTANVGPESHRASGWRKLAEVRA